MNEYRYEPDEATLASDDELLDMLGKGLRPPGDDTIALAMFMWRDDLTITKAASTPARARRRRRITHGIIAAAIAATLGSGVTVSLAYNAEPFSPLFPIIELVDPGKASAISADTARTDLGTARAAVAEKRYPEAQTLLTRVEALIAKVISLAEREALLAELTKVRNLLSVALGIPLPAPSPTPKPVPSPGASTQPTPSPGAGTPTPSPSGSPQPLLPPLLSPLLPSLLPSLPPILG